MFDDDDGSSSSGNGGGGGGNGDDVQRRTTSEGPVDGTGQIYAADGSLECDFVRG